MAHFSPQSVHDVDANGSLVSDPRRRHLPASQKLIVAGLILALSLGFIWLGRPSKKDEAAPLSAMFAVNSTPFSPSPTDVAPDASAVQPATESAAPAPAPSEPPQPGPRPEDSPIFAYSSGGQGIDKPLQQAGSGREHGSDKRDTSFLRSQPSAENDLAMRMKPTLLQPSQATPLPHPDFMITQGTIISCVLQTAIDTNLAGYVKCVLPQDVRGATNHVVLLDRGTTVVGEIQRGLQQGDTRVFVLWTRAETPGHAVVSLASPGADELGRSGLPGMIDNHLSERFGGAVLLSIIQGAFQAASSYSGSTTGGASFNSFQSNGEQAADTALRATINIPPTLKKHQGDTVSIFVARDLDFSNVYELRMTSEATKGTKRHSRHK